jgi:hypothetical protein
LQAAAHEWAERRAKQIEVTREMLADLRREIRTALSVLRLPDFRSVVLDSDAPPRDLAGFVVQAFSYSIGFLTLTAIAVASLMFFASFMPETRRRTRLWLIALKLRPLLRGGNLLPIKPVREDGSSCSNSFLYQN